MEIDYNIHKSNSTYFSDLDVSRTHLVCYVCRGGLQALTYNAQSKAVLDPATGRPVNGAMGIALGGVFCSFRREIPGYKSYELWSNLLSWDRKWLYIVTHIVAKGSKPSEWLDPRCGRMKTRKEGEPEVDYQQKIYATALSKYVFKVGRFTVNPAIVLAESGLLPERPGGWMGGPNGVGSEEDLGDVSDTGEWGWKQVENERRKGMEYAIKMGGLDGMQKLFNGGRDGVIGKFNS
jgi:hypothetical protein